MGVPVFCHYQYADKKFTNVADIGEKRYCNENFIRYETNVSECPGLLNQSKPLNFQQDIKIETLDEGEERTEDSIFDKVYHFFTTPATASYIAIGVIIGTLAVALLTGLIIASVGTAGVAPLVFGAVTAGILGATGSGFSLAGIALGIIGLFGGVAWVSGKISESGEQSPQQQPDFQHQGSTYAKIKTELPKTTGSPVFAKNPIPQGNGQTSPLPVNGTTAASKIAVDDTSESDSEKFRIR